MLFLACVAGVPSHAQKVSDGKLESRYNITVPHEFLYGNEPVLLLQTGSELRTVNVYDENIDLVKSIDLKDLNFNYQLVYKIEEREAKDATLVDSDPVREYSSYEAFVQSEMNVNPTFTEKCLKIEKYLCFWLVKARPIVRSYSNHIHSYQKSKSCFTSMIVSYHKCCPINRTYRTRPTIRNSSSGEAVFGAYALL